MSQQITINVQNGTTQHGNPSLLCSPPAWSDILSFFLGNYIAHAATVLLYPGESLWSTLTAIFYALTLPATGVGRGLTAIGRHAAFQSTSLDKAARAGALCMVVRNRNWAPEPGQRMNDLLWRPRITRSATQGAGNLLASTRLGRMNVKSLLRGITVEDSPSFTPGEPVALDFYQPPWMFEASKNWQYVDTAWSFVTRHTQVHGAYSLSEGYSLAYVPRDAMVTHPIDSPNIPEQCGVSSNWSPIKPLVAIIQLSFACSTLAKSYGNEIAENGYGAFSLTIVPFAIMSLLNLIGLLTNPSYPALYMIRSDVMDEAESRHSRFDGVVGRLVSSEVDLTGTGLHKVSGVFQEVPRPDAEEVPRHVHLPTESPPDNEPKLAATSSGMSFLFSTVLRALVSRFQDERLSAPRPRRMLFIPDHATPAGDRQDDGIELQNLDSNLSNFQVQVGWRASRGIRDFPISLLVPLCHGFNRHKTHYSSVDFTIATRIWAGITIRNLKRENKGDRALGDRALGDVRWEHRARQRPPPGNWNPTVDILKLHPTSARKNSPIVLWVTLFISSLSIAVIGGFTRFQARNSSHAARSIYMTWLVLGIYIGSAYQIFAADPAVTMDMNYPQLVLSFTIYAIPSGFGFYEVVKMMNQYGVCITIN